MELDVLSDGMLKAAIVALAGELSAVQARLMDAVAEAERRALWADDGAASGAAWLAAHLGVSHRTARAWVEVAEALEELPGVRRALERGEVSYDQARLMCRSSGSETEAADVDVARASSYE